MTNSNKGNNPKERADVPPVLPSEQPTGSDAGGVLSPDDLDITESPHVAEVEKGRFVVSADGPPAVSSRPDQSEPAQPPARNSSRPAREQSTPNSHEPLEHEATEPPHHQSGVQPVQSPETARSILATELERSDARYALDIVSQLNGTTIRHRTTSNDVVGTFDSLVLWYAQNVATETPTHRTASLLFEKSEFTASLSSQQVRQAARRHGLSKSSTIGELLDAIE
ncbi:DUF7500 family protein [Natrarchaeobaculum sulfurireducens]|uniref:Flagella cluster protein n=1 Tax=Natrarchaeobaculum sulfurireducens TaxID=2044521 RepID=A0A346PNU6_9EURY|nr:flagella cluster protein [Natrarchaeobaculum sulfurireducens]AXR78759.1 hypothetical protein AArc1_2444 [Natrarchaeobaculum sulfurireducens]AXR81191.1 hypothetical protein AArcMg_1175 [Natrarchaeobaculum sulfurireducens]